MKWLTWSQVAQPPPLPPATEEVAKKPTYITVTLKAWVEVLQADSGHTASLKVQVYKVVIVAPYEREAIVG